MQALYHFLATGELEKAVEDYRSQAQTYPNTRGVAHNQVGLIFNLLGQYENAAAEEREAWRLLPDSTSPVVNLMVAYMALNRPDEARNIFDEGMAHNVGDSQMCWMRYRLAFIQGDQAAMREQATWSAAHPPTDDWLLSEQAVSASYGGVIRVARELSWRAVQSARDAGREETAAVWWARQALAEAEVGEGLRARELAKQTLAWRSGKVVQIMAALTFARAGDTAQAEIIAAVLNQQFPVDTMVQNYWLPTIRAQVEMSHRNPRRAIDILQATIPYELGIPSDYSGPGNLLPAYVRGEAYLQVNDAQRAAAEFQKVIDHPGIVVNFITGALAHLQLGSRAGDDGRQGCRAEVVSGFPHPLEGRRSRHPHLPASPSRVRHASVISPNFYFVADTRCLDVVGIPDGPSANKKLCGCCREITFTLDDPVV